jgi:hypothetical protein
MYRCIKLLFLITILFSLTNCEEQEILDARKRTDPNGPNGGDGSSAARTFLATYSSANTSQAGCPAGPGAELNLDFGTSLFEFQIPVNDTTGAYSPILDTANANKVIEGTPIVNDQTDTFAGSYTVSDPDGDLDITVCDGAGGGYANVSRVTMSGAVNDTTVNGTYEIVNICMTGNNTPVVCEGTFTGSETSN